MAARRLIAVWICTVLVLPPRAEGARSRADPGPICDWEADLPLHSSDSPRGAVLRMLRAYCQRDLEAYAALLTADFLFETLDPELLATIPDGLSREDEIASARNLFGGHVRPDGTVVPPARGIRIRAERLRVLGDPTEPTDPQRFQVVVVESLVFEVSVEPTVWHIVGESRDVFHVVRGDAARCADGQKADSDHWYVRRWIEVPEAAPPAPPADARPQLSPGQGAGSRRSK